MQIEQLALDPAVREIVVREGDAAKIYDQEAVSCSGILKAPFQFLDSEKITRYVAKDGTLYVNLDAKSLKLVLNEENHFKHTISGQLTEFADLKPFNFNAENATFNHRDLIRLFKKYKRYFINHEVHADFMKKLQDYQAKVTKEYNDFKENSGNQKTSLKVTVDSQYGTLTFQLSMPLYKGYDKVTFQVEIVADAESGQLMFRLEALQLFELLPELAEKYIGEEIQRFNEKFPVSVVFVS